MSKDTKLSNFTKYTKGNLTLPCILFVASKHCIYCHMAAPEVKVAERALKPTGIRVFLVDADKDPDTVDRLKVEGFPTILIVDKDRKVFEFRGPRTGKAIADFAISKNLSK
jgi:thiol-disulfide isomerase/thioredoxin